MMPRNAVPVYTAASLCGRPDTNTVRDWLKPMEHSFIATADRRQNDHAAIAMMRGDFVQSGRRGILDVLAGETHTIRHLMGGDHSLMRRCSGFQQLVSGIEGTLQIKFDLGDAFRRAALATTARSGVNDKRDAGFAARQFSSHRRNGGCGHTVSPSGVRWMC